jgi:glucose/arabinose dehydrogenase
MRPTGWIVATAFIVLAGGWIVRAAADKVDKTHLVTGQAAFGVAVGPDGALFVTDDGSHSIWRVAYGGK